MATYSGIDGKVSNSSGNTIANLSEWTLDIKHNIVEDTEFTDTWKSNVKGLREGSGSLKGSFDDADTYQANLQTAVLSGTAVVGLRLYIDGTSYFSGNAWITDMKVGNKVDGKVDVDFDYITDGAWTLT